MQVFSTVAWLAFLAIVCLTSSWLARAGVELWSQGFLKPWPGLGLALGLGALVAGMSRDIYLAAAALLVSVTAMVLSGLARRAGKSLAAYARDGLVALIQR